MERGLAELLATPETDPDQFSDFNLLSNQERILANINFILAMDARIKFDARGNPLSQASQFLRSGFIALYLGNCVSSSQIDVSEAFDIIDILASNQEIEIYFDEKEFEAASYDACLADTITMSEADMVITWGELPEVSKLLAVI